MPHTKNPTSQLPKDRLLAKISLAFFNRPLLTAFLWLVLIVFGALSYTTLLKREGFPSISIPLAVVQGTYFAGDAGTVDSQVAKPITDLALKQAGVSTVQTQSSANFYVITIQYKSSVDAHQATAQLEQQVHRKLHLPTAATAKFSVPYFGVTGGDSKKIDALISLYNPRASADTAQLLGPTKAAVAYLNAHKPPLVKEVFLRDPYQTATSPLTGQTATLQQSFDRYSNRSDNVSAPALSIGVVGVDNVDVIKLDQQLHSTLAGLSRQA